MTNDTTTIAEALANPSPELAAEIAALLAPLAQEAESAPFLSPSELLALQDACGVADISKIPLTALVRAKRAKLAKLTKRRGAPRALTAEEEREAFVMTQDKSLKEVADAFGVSIETIKRIRQRGMRGKL